MRIGLVALAGALFLCAPVTAQAQLADGGDGGVALGHIHLTVTDLDFYQRVFALAGGLPVKNGQLEMLQFPGILILARKGEPQGAPAGSSVNHIGFLVKDIAEASARWRAGGLTYEQREMRTDAGTLLVGNLTGPDGVRLEMVEDKTISHPIEFQHIHFSALDPEAMRAWYLEMFGGIPNMRRNTIVNVTLPGGHLSFAKAESPVVGTRGRSLDHIGFEVKNLEQFVKKLEAKGVKMDRPYTKPPNSTLAIAFLTDPWGTSIELTENLAPRE